MTAARTADLGALPLADETKASLQSLLDAGTIDGALVWVDSSSDPNFRVQAWGPGCMDKTEARALRAVRGLLSWVWAPREAGAPRVQQGSRTARALALLEKDSTLTPHRAAVEVGIDSAAVYRALKRQREPICPCCGRPR